MAAFLGFEKEDYVAGMQFGEGIEQEVVSCGFLAGIQLGLLVDMGQKRGDVIEKITVAVGKGRKGCPIGLAMSFFRESE